MTNSDVIDYFLDCLMSGTDVKEGFAKEYYEMAISALKKQVPEEPARENKCRYCKGCGKILAKRYYTYCPRCGQRVKKRFGGD